MAIAQSDVSEAAQRKEVIRDRYARPIISLRISVTQRCNLKCFYCHREGQSPSNVEMSPNEIARVAEVAAGLGIRRFKITGGEPLLRCDIEEIVKRIASVPNVEEVSMTTNGVFLAEKAAGLAKAGLQRVNISLDSLDSQTYNRITGGQVNPVIEGVKEALKSGLQPVKINTVILKGLNDFEIPEIMSFARKTGAIVQLIELEPIGLDSETYLKYHHDLQDVEDELRRVAEQVDVRRLMHNRRKYLISGLEVEVVRPIDNSEFCASCTRMRLTSDGKLKPCLMRNDNLVDILTPIREGTSNQDLEKLFMEAIMRREPYFKI
jgi:cyclic pyranopterin phosphate synthase